VGTELTEGRIQDAHLRFFGQELTRLGLTVTRCAHLPDDRALFRAEVDRSVAEAEVLIVTGGLGPTSDDLTREVVAEAAGVGLHYHPEVWSALEARFAGRRLAEANRRQCYAPEGFVLMANPHGTAPGFRGRIGGVHVYALPGPPRELGPMFRDEVEPCLRREISLSPVEETRGSAFHVGESNLEDALARCSRPGVAWGTRIADDRIVFHLRGGTARDREAVLTDTQALVGATHIRRGDRGAAELLFDALVEARARLIVAESCTGGLLSTWLTDIPGSSRVFDGGVVAYSNELKQAILGVPGTMLLTHGAVSKEAVLEMCRGALRLGDADYAVAISGVAGPDGGTEDKPVGTVWIAVAARTSEPTAECFLFRGSREAVRRRSASAACILAECLVTGKGWKPYVA
jgi:nicotinamide-nucleotide amidase